jgi:Arc/MetJ family transcription regulator
MNHRTTIELDEALLSESKRILGTSGIRETVEGALRELVRLDHRNRLKARILSGSGIDLGADILDQTRPVR